MPQTFYPLLPFADEVKNELDNRRGKRPNSLTYTTQMGWCRISSLAEVSFPKGSDNIKNGFVLYNNVGFDKMYGFEDTSTSGVLGYTVEGSTHKLSDVGYMDLKRPPPGITNIISEMNSGEGKFVKANFTLKCHDQFQLQYLMPFFLTPGITITMEWGWSTDIPAKLLPIHEISEMVTIRDNWQEEQDRRLAQNGNYEMVLGMITGYDFSLQPAGGYECNIEVRSIGYSIYGLSNVNETYLNEEGEVDKKTATKIPEYILKLKSKEWSQFGNGWILNKDGKPYLPKTNGEETRIFTSDIVERSKEFKSQINDKDVWVSFGLFISLLNAEKSFLHKQREKDSDDSRVFQIDITNSWITGHPNMKSTDGSVLLIPNPYAPAFAVDEDNITKLSADYRVLSSESVSKFEQAQKSLLDVAKSLDPSSDLKSSYDNTLQRVQLDKIICGNRTVDSEVASFPSKEDPYYGHISNLYISKKLIEESLEAELTIQSLFDILRKINFAAGNIWDFDVIASPTNKNKLVIIDHNFPGFDDSDNGNLVNVGTIKNNPDIYTFSTIESDSIVRNLDFSVNLPDQVATQIMLDGSDSNVSRDDEKFFQRAFSEQGDIKIVDKLRGFESKSKDKPKGDQKEGVEKKVNRISPQEEELYYLVTKTIDRSEVTIRLVEPTRELVSAAIDKDESPFNNARFNGLVQGITVNLTLTGISGIKFMDVFSIDNLPYPYNTNAIFQVTNVKHSWSNNDWITNVEAMIRPTPELFIN